MDLGRDLETAPGTSEAVACAEYALAALFSWQVRWDIMGLADLMFCEAGSLKNG